MQTLFLHGWTSIPGGVKPTYLKSHGHEALNPALPDDDFDAAVRIAQAEYHWRSPWWYSCDSGWASSCFRERRVTATRAVLLRVIKKVVAVSINDVSAPKDRLA